MIKAMQKRRIRKEEREVLRLWEVLYGRDGGGGIGAILCAKYGRGGIETAKLRRRRGEALPQCSAEIEFEEVSQELSRRRDSVAARRAALHGGNCPA